jgi:hypothetical protein
VGEPIEFGMARCEGAGHAQAGTLGVGDVNVDHYRRVDAPARTAASHVLILLNTREAINAWSGVRKDYSIVDPSHCCESKGEIT